MPVEKNRFRRHQTPDTGPPDTRHQTPDVWSGVQCPTTSGLPFSLFRVFHIGGGRGSGVQCPVPGVLTSVFLTAASRSVCHVFVVFSARSRTVVGSPPQFFRTRSSTGTQAPVEV
ncbi:unnamed protein product [Ectocarpus sp. 6 AP-2014]